MAVFGHEKPQLSMPCSFHQTPPVLFPNKATHKDIKKTRNKGFACEPRKSLMNESNLRRGPLYTSSSRNSMLLLLWRFVFVYVRLGLVTRTVFVHRGLVKNDVKTISQAWKQCRGFIWNCKSRSFHFYSSSVSRLRLCSPFYKVSLLSYFTSHSN